MISREEAIKHLKEIRGFMFVAEWKESIDMAITAMQLNLDAAKDAIDKAIKRAQQHEWKWTKEEKPDSTRHVIIATGSEISHYGYYLEPKDKWYTSWKCEEEIPEPVMWREMPEPPEESIPDECCG